MSLLLQLLIRLPNGSDAEVKVRSQDPGILPHILDFIKDLL